MNGKDIADATKLFKKMVQCLLRSGTNNCLCYDYIWMEDKKPEDLNNTKPWNRKQIEKLLLIVTIANSDRFTAKSKPITYIGAFVELNN